MGSRYPASREDSYPERRGRPRARSKQPEQQGPQWKETVVEVSSQKPAASPVLSCGLKVAHSAQIVPRHRSTRDCRLGVVV